MTAAPAVKPSVTLFWFRRDMRLDDNRGLYHALADGPAPVLPLFIFDSDILNKLENLRDARVAFIHREVAALHGDLRKHGSTLLVRHGRPCEIFEKLLGEFQVRAVYANHDYEPYARDRDAHIAALLQSCGVEFRTFKDQVIFEKDEVVKSDGRPYTVFTPFSRQWRARLTPGDLRSYDTLALAGNFFPCLPAPLPTLRDLGFAPAGRAFPPHDIEKAIISHYEATRDMPGDERGTSRLGVYLRFGTISIRRLACAARQLNETFLNELIWREFFMMVLWHFPHVEKSAFRPAYDGIRWINDEEQFAAWREGHTGVPIVDAGMRELAQTGFMHNRARMIVASYLTKHLLIDWRWGELWFARHLLDFELASNNGNWQWAAGTGCDAVPYFRVFNPALQAKKFDPDDAYVRRWVPEWGSDAYPARPIVEHAAARVRAIRAYQAALGKL